MRDKRSFDLCLPAILAFLGMSGSAWSLGLGELEVFSRLNEPLEARIELSVTAEELENLRIGLADAEAFKRAGLSRPFFLTGLKFEVEVSERKADYILVTAPTPIREPILNFLLEADWANGRLLREYTILLDPPDYDLPVARTPTVPELGGTPPAPFVRAPVAGAAPPGAPPAAVPPSPSAPFSPSGSTLSGRLVPGTNYQVRRGDTLWAIASRMRPDRSVSIQQTMFALLRQHPEAFFLNGNINALKTGPILRAPSIDEIRALNRANAIALTQQHNDLWNEYRRTRIAGRPPPAPPPAIGVAAAPPTPVAQPPGQIQERAELRVGSEVGGVGQGPGGDRSGEAIQQQRLELEEDLVSKQQELDELSRRLAETEDLLNSSRRLIEVKDDEIKKLQTSLQQQSQDPEQAQRIVQLQGQNTQLQQQLDQAQQEAQALRDLPPAAPATEQAEQLAQLREQNAQLQQQLEQAQQAQQAQPPAALDAAQTQQLAQLQQQNNQLLQQLEQAQQEMEVLRAQPPAEPDAGQAQQLAQLQQQNDQLQQQLQHTQGELQQRIDQLREAQRQTATPAPAEPVPAEPEPVVVEPAAPEEAAPPAEPEPVVVAEQPEVLEPTVSPSLVSRLTSAAGRYVLPLGVILGAVVVAAAGLLFYRQRQLAMAAAEDEGFAMASEEDITEMAGDLGEEVEDMTPLPLGEDVTERVEEGVPAEEEAAALAGAVEEGAEGQADLDIGDLGEALDVDFGAVDGDTEADQARMAEINVLLAYEQFGQAVDSLREAIQEEPDNLSYRLKLLEVFRTKNDPAAFEQEARALQEITGGEGDDWQTALGLWNEMSTGRELFSAAAPIEEETLESTQRLSEELAQQALGDLTDEAPAAGEEEEQEGGDVLDMVSGLDLDTAESALAEEEPAAAEEAPLEFDMGESATEEPAAEGESLELDIGEGASAAAEEPAAEELAATEADMSLEMDTTELGEPDVLAGLMEEEAGPEEGPAQKEGAQDEELSMELDMGELEEAAEEEPTLTSEGESGQAAEEDVSSKLDLARAYLELGDSENAKISLQDVLEDGDDHQRQEAEQLLAQIQ